MIMGRYGQHCVPLVGSSSSSNSSSSLVSMDDQQCPGSSGDAVGADNMLFLGQLIHLSQSKLSLEIDADMSRCLRKAVLVQNALRRSVLAAELQRGDDTMQSTSSSPSRRSNRPIGGQRLFSSDNCVDDMLSDDGSSTHDRMDDDASIVPDSLSGSSGMMAVDAPSVAVVTGSVATVNVIVVSPLTEVSPPPSPDALEREQDMSALLDDFEQVAAVSAGAKRPSPQPTDSPKRARLMCDGMNIPLTL